MTGVIRAPEVHFAGVKFRSSKATCTSFLSPSRPTTIFVCRCRRARREVCRKADAG